MITTAECRELSVPIRERLQQMYDVLPAFSEMFWFMVSLVLFMVLGPFAAPIALVAIFTIDSEDRGIKEPESAE